MNKKVNVFTAATITGFSPVAFASDMSGIASIIIGIPAMSVALAIYGVLALFDKLPNWVIYFSIALFVPLALFGTLMSIDAWANMASSGAPFSLLYYLIFASVFACFLKVLKKRDDRAAGVVTEAHEPSEILGILGFSGLFVGTLVVLGAIWLLLLRLLGL